MKISNRRVIPYIILILTFLGISGCVSIYNVVRAPNINGVILSDAGPVSGLTVNICTFDLYDIELHNKDCKLYAQTVTDNKGRFHLSGFHNIKFADFFASAPPVDFQIKLIQGGKTLNVFTYGTDRFPGNLDARCYLSKKLGNKCRLSFTS